MADVTYLGQRDYSMRAWLDPDKLAALNLSATDVVDRHQPAERASGRRADRPAAGPSGQQFQLTINTLGRLTDPEQFGDIILKVGPGSSVAQTSGDASGDSDATGAVPPTEPRARRATAGANASMSTGIVRLRDVARGDAWLAAVRSNLHARRQAVGGPVDLPASRLQRAGHGQRRLRQDGGAEELAFPMGSIIEIVYDTTPFIRESIDEVFKTLRDADHPGGHRRAGVPAELAGHADSADRRAGRHRRHVRRHGRAWAFR